MKKSPLRSRPSGTADEDRYRHQILPEIEIDFPRDRKDTAFLVCAQLGKADYLITGDSDFSEAQALIQTPIVSVAQFAQAVAPELLSGY